MADRWWYDGSGKVDVETLLKVVDDMEAEIERLEAGIKEALDYWNHHGGVEAITILERLLKGGDDGETDK